MNTRCATLTTALALTIAVAAPIADAGDLASERAHRDAARLRAQPQGDQRFNTDQPGWLVERAENTSIRLSVLSQFRYTYSERNSMFVMEDNESTIGFSQPRIRLAMDGTIVSSQLNYRVSFDFGDAALSRGRGNDPLLEGGTGTARLLDAYAQYNFEGRREGYYLRVGQFANSLFTEEAIDAKHQQTIDRSLSSEIFGPGYTQGIALGRVTKDFAWELLVSDGGRFVGSREVDNTAFLNENEADLGLGLRVDWKLMGHWDQFADFSNFRGADRGAKLGAGVLYQFTGQSNPGQYTPPFLAATAESTQVVTWTLDYQYEGDGWNFFAAYYGQFVDFVFEVGRLDPWHNALVFQGGWFINDDIELYGRFETFWIDKDFRNGFGVPDGFIHRILTLGATRYLLPESHAAKISADISYAFDSLFVLSVGPDSIALPDPATTGFTGLSNEEFVARIQLQFAF